MRVLVSVRNADEAKLAAAAGVDFIDCKEPSAGALGGLDVATIAAIVAAVRDACGRPAASGGAPDRHASISATIGDWPADALDAALIRARAVAACGVDYVKVGVLPGALAGDWIASLAREPYAVVPVFIADAGYDAELVRRAAGCGFPALMIDTAEKRGGSLLDRLGAAALADFAALARSGGALAGLAGSLRVDDLPLLARAGADFAGFRGAVCDGDRAGQLDPHRLARLLALARG